MPKKNKKSRRRRSPEPAAAWTKYHEELPDRSNTGELLAYWTEKLSAGFVPEQAQESLAKVAKADLSAGDRRKLEALASLTADPLAQSCSLCQAPAVPASALIDRAGGRLFIAGGAGEGLTCLELSSGRKLWHLDAEQIRRPGGMVLADELLLVCDRWKHCVLAVSAADGTRRWTLDTAGGEKNRLDEPSDVTLVEKEDGSELWVADRSNHRICRYSTQGRHLGNLGRRGLVAEEIIWNNTKGQNQPEAIFLEFPETVFTATDIDKEKSVFVWDSGNCRVLCFSTTGVLKRVIRLETGAPAGHRHALRLRLLDSPAGPVPVATDESDSALMLWSPQGDLIIRIILGPGLFGPGSRTEAVRIISSADGDNKDLSLVTSKPAVVDIKKEVFDLPSLLQARAAVQPDQARWLLALWENQDNSKAKNEVLAQLWSGPFAEMGSEGIVRSLLHPDRIIEGQLSLNLSRIETFIEESGRAGFEQAAAELSRAVDSHLESLIEHTENILCKQALPEEVVLDTWSKAQASLDVAFFQNKGNNQNEALRQDSTLESMWKLPDSTRRSGWNYRLLSCELKRREKSPLLRRRRAARLASLARDLLVRRLENLRRLEQQLDFKSEPNRFHPEELIAIHRCLITIKSIGQVTGILAAEIAAAANGDEANGQPAADLRACALLAPDGDLWERLYEKIGRQESNCQNIDDPVGASRPAAAKVSPKRRLKLLRNLVERMANYCKTLDESGKVAGIPGKITKRQKEFFALKAALLIAVLKIDRFKSRGLDELTERARKLAGTSWEEIVPDLTH